MNRTVSTVSDYVLPASCQPGLNRGSSVHFEFDALTNASQAPGSPVLAPMKRSVSALSEYVLPSPCHSVASMDGLSMSPQAKTSRFFTMQRKSIPVGTAPLLSPPLPAQQPVTSSALPAPVVMMQPLVAPARSISEFSLPPACASRTVSLSSVRTVSSGLGDESARNVTERLPTRW